MQRNRVDDCRSAGPAPARLPTESALQLLKDLLRNRLDTLQTSADDDISRRAPENPAYRSSIRFRQAIATSDGARFQIRLHSPARYLPD